MVYKMFYLNLALIVWASLLTYSRSSGQSCDISWFGSSTCLYKCRCTSSCYPTTGACQAGGKCQGGWFGPACQYADLAYKLPPTSLTDGDDSTCLPPGSGDTVTLNLTRNYPFTWLRLHVSGSGKEFLEKFKIQFRGAQNLTCQDLQQSKVDETTIDVYCRVSESVQFVTVTGELVKYLCSIYISKGRNVALHQYVSQSTIYYEKSNLTNFKNISFDATKAVDGNTSQIFYDQSCTHTGDQSADITNAQWHVNLDRTFDVAIFALYNRNDQFMIRLQNFTLESFDAQNNLVYRYTDPGSPPQLIYNLIPNGFIPVKSTNIRLPYGILTLCEVEIYGDAHCSPGRYGRECENNCNCNSGDTCFISTGGCSSGCAAGFKGEDCKTVCDVGTFGVSCQQNCSSRCSSSGDISRSVCDHVDGSCLFGCEAGYQGLTCSSPCDLGTFGQNCQQSCSSHCVYSGDNSRSACDHVTGICLFGCEPGYQGSTCSSLCDVGTFGRGCRQNCSSHCRDSGDITKSVCYHVDGICLFGCKNGYQESTCSSHTVTSSQGPEKDVIIPAVIVPVAVILIIAVFIVVFMFRRHKRLRKNSSNNIHMNKNEMNQVDSNKPEIKTSSVVTGTNGAETTDAANGNKGGSKSGIESSNVYDVLNEYEVPTAQAYINKR